MELKRTFDEVSAAYDKWRPTYMPELYNDIWAYSNLRPGSRALEIGIGTGQATTPFLKTGCHVTAVELGDNLAAYCRLKFSDCPKFDVHAMPFEEFESPDGSFDIVYSATAFHWIPEQIGYPKVHRLLRSGGTFARFANHPYRDHDELHEALQQVYVRYMPQAQYAPERFEQEAQSRAELAKSYGFVDVEFHLYHRTRTMDADGYAALLGTYSDHLAMGEQKLNAFSDEIRQVIHRFGNKIDILDTMDLCLARKP